MVYIYIYIYMSIPFMYIIYLVTCIIIIYICAFMTYNLHRKIKFAITRHFESMCAPVEKIKNKK